MYIDSHIHLSHKLYDGVVPCVSPGRDNGISYYNRDGLVEELKNAEIGLLVEPAIDLESNYKLLELAEKYSDFLFSAVGVHPTRTWNEKWNNRKIISELSSNSRVVAIGETGLDYHYERRKQHRFIQKMWFVYQLKLANKKKLPVILHIRDAHKDAQKILRRHKPIGGIVHCFNGTIDDARFYHSMGLKLGIGASIFTNPDLESIIKNIPLDAIALETDGPYVKGNRPEGLSKKQWEKVRNTSLIIPMQIAPRISEIKGVSIEEVEEVTTKTANEVFHLSCEHI